MACNIYSEFIMYLVEHNVITHITQKFKNSRNLIFINRDLQEKYPFLRVNIVLRVHVVRMVLKHRLVDMRTTQQAGPFQRRDRYSHLKKIWYHIARYVYQAYHS